MTAQSVQFLCLYRDEAGTATVEYVLLLALVSLATSASIASIGPDLVTFFEVRVMWLSLPIP